MQLPDWAARHPLALMLAACVAGGLLLGWLANPLPPETTVRHGEASWAPPRAAEIQRFNDATFLSLRQSTVWPAPGKAGTAGNAGNTVASAPPWSLVGIVLTPRPVALVLDTASAQVERVATGSALPDGATLEKIERDAISVSSAGCNRRIELFHIPQDAETGACKPAAAADASPAGPGEHK